MPKVLAWSSKAEENPVGAEYIIMEKVKGVQLSSVWRTLPFDKKAEIIKTLARYQSIWMSNTLKQYGSLYYAQDIPNRQDQPVFSYVNKDGSEIEDDRFAIGPTVHRQSIDYGRAQVDFDRGPCRSMSLSSSNPLAYISHRGLCRRSLYSHRKQGNRMRQSSPTTA